MTALPTHGPLQDHVELGQGDILRSQIAANGEAGGCGIYVDPAMEVHAAGLDKRGEAAFGWHPTWRIHN